MDKKEDMVEPRNGDNGDIAHRVLWAMGLETGGDGGSAVTSAPIIPTSLKLAKTNWNSWNCPLPPADDQHPLFYLQTYVSLSSKCS